LTPSLIWTNQYANPLNPAAFVVLGNELVNQLNLDSHKGGIQLFMAVSTGGSISGVGSYLKERYGKRLEVIAVDAVGSVIFGDIPKTRYLNGIGSSLADPPNLDRSVIDSSFSCVGCRGIRNVL
jgi:cysteine synthase